MKKPNPITEPIKSGDRFQEANSGAPDYYQLNEAGMNRLILNNTKTGVRLSESVPVQDTHDVTQEEFQKLTNGKELNFIK